MGRKRVKISRPSALFSAAFLAFFALKGCGPDSVSRDGQRARWHNNQGVVYMDQHHYVRAKEEFQRAIALDPTHANSHANLGIAYYSLGKYDSAGTALQTALDHDPQHLHSHYTLGLIYSAQGKQYELALKAFEQVVKADPDDPLVHYYLGQVKAKLGQSEEAIEALRTAIRLDPYNTSAHYALANQLRRLGLTEEWQAALDTFDGLSRAGHEGISTSYQGQGKYAEAVADAGYADSDEDDTRGPFLFSAAATPMEGLPDKIRFSSMVDFDGDGDPDLLVGDDQPLLYRNDGTHFAQVPDFKLPLPEETRIGAAVFGDADNDGRSDLVLSGELTLLLRNDEAGFWILGDTLAGPTQRTVFADSDHDGDLDLLALGQKGVRLFANDGTGTFTPVSSPAGIATEQPGRRAIFSDFDNDRDVDSFVLSAGSVHLFTNNRDGTFADIGAEMGLHSVDAVDICIEDFDQDGYMDLGVLGPAGRLAIHANQAGKGFISRSRLTVPQARVHGLRPADLDNDGDLDLLVSGDQGIHLLAYHGGEFHLEKEVVGSGANADPVLVADFDGNGATDLWAQGNLWTNAGHGGQWIKIAVRGLNSNRGGVGAKVEVKTANRHQKRVVRGGSEDFGTLNFGLATADSVEFVRVLWPSGVRQTELATPAAQRLTLTELNRKGTSCPILYVWDGEEFRFVTDILGGSIIGYLLAPGEYYAPDTDEYVRVGGMVPKDGKYILQLANQLEEVIYVDAMHLLAVDHPAGVEVFPNERLLSSPPYPEFRLYSLKDLQPPRRAIDHLGRDIIASLRSIDDDWYEGFERERIHGYARDYAIELDLGDLSRCDHPVLLGYGWVDYAHSSSNWAAAQQGLALYPPRVEVADGKGNWMEVSADMGSPAGLPKHLLFDLKDLFPSADYRLRIITNTPIYWDQFLVGRAVEAALQVHRLLPGYGDLHWRGYPEHTSIKGTFAFRYHYDRLRLHADWGAHGGAFTRFGEVTELVTAVDDRFVIMFHGDELTATFDAEHLPPLQAGQQRTFMLYADGFGKDMDFHSAHSLTVAPLPFHGMSGYPYPATEAYPRDQEHLDYLLEYNTRRIKGHYE